ncbi:isocitrate lyase/PEP mutase family protein [Brevundimonas lenta]|uniref:2-methylisocitrate lyase-like PEP mutase family enzyme n=1 Tax=Brevundimonas lenta TaxID=424796 RepID=A0A7W6JDL2_9CAUL|nr:isocitrate lyase/phosphoenolpyruvate mutase family protein [Brevundimonas lenta]MBB4082182.1 2-methylisocitrate lyase-like PEP mutase family enzyme [Brevundimonas lenta]
MTAFHDLHRSGLLILPNAWDGASAALMRSLGAKAIATTSAGCAWSLGWPDGDVLPTERAVQMCADVVRAAQGVPVSVDFEGGYSDDPAEVAATAQQLVEAGAQGINIEDGGGSPELLAAKIAAIRAAVGGALFINARCDVWLRGVGEAETRVAEALRRGAIYQAAGADGLFTPGLTDAAGIAELTGGTDMPVNLLAYPGLPGAAELERLGVRRLSAGSGLASAAYGRTAALAKDFLQDGASEPMGDGALSWGEMNALMP